MIYTLENENIRVVASSNGGELHSIKKINEIPVKKNSKFIQTAICNAEVQLITERRSACDATWMPSKD